MIPSEEELQIRDMATLERVVQGCTRCGLRAGCRGVVFGDGNPRARLMLIGEGPGADEDRLGRPFVGRAGQLLDRILAACGFNRQRHVYIANIVKCRPPGNRTPTPDERAACLPNLRAQMRLVNPVIVVLLGSTALQALIDPAARITRARGRWIHKDGIWYMPTYHPAALLRNPSLKRECWHDFKLVIDKYRELVDPHHESPHYPLAEAAAAAAREPDEPAPGRAPEPGAGRGGGRAAGGIAAGAGAAAGGGSTAGVPAPEGAGEPLTEQLTLFQDDFLPGEAFRGPAGGQEEPA